jgi:phage terminase small subunit
MPIKSGMQTAKERRFVTEMAKSADPLNAARLAGYAAPGVSATQLMQRPAIVQSVAKQVAARIENTLVPMALATLEDVLHEDNREKYQGRLRVDAADKVLKHYRSSQADGEPEKELHELTAAELRQRYEAEKLKLQAFDALVAEAENTIEHEAGEAPSPTEGGGTGDDIFG